MKKRGGYEYLSNDEKTEFRFVSIGAKGAIPKIVEFVLYEETWNLAFRDETKDGFNDAVISDNDDMRKVLQTVANIVHAFIEKYPDRKIYIEPVDRKRRLLYNRIFKEKQEEIMAIFSIKGALFLEGRLEDYVATNIYDAFVLSLKKTNFED